MTHRSTKRREARIEEMTDRLLKLARTNDPKAHLQAEELLATDKTAALAALRNDTLASTPVYAPSMSLHYELLGFHYDAVPPEIRAHYANDMAGTSFEVPGGEVSIGAVPASFIATFWQRTGPEVAARPQLWNITNEHGFDLRELTLQQLELERQVNMVKSVKNVLKLGGGLVVAIADVFIPSPESGIIAGGLIMYGTTKLVQIRLAVRAVRGNRRAYEQLTRSPASGGGSGTIIEMPPSAPEKEV